MHNYTGICIFLPLVAGVVIVCLSITNPPAVYATDSYRVIGTHPKAELTSEERERIISHYLQKARSRYEEGRYDEALKLWKDIMIFDPANQEAEEGIRQAQEKIDKINAFFGEDVFPEIQEARKLSLSDCIKVAQENSLLFKVAKEQINLGKIKVWEARRAFLPSLTLSYSETKGIRSGGKIEGVEYGIEGKQPAFHSGELMYTLAQAKTNLKIAQENYDKVRMELSLDVAEAYYAFVKAKKFLAFVTSLHEEVKPLYELAKKKHEKAVVPDIEYLNTESQYNQIYYRSVSAESDLKLAKLTLEQKMNVAGIENVDVVVDVAARDVDKDIETYLTLAMQNRPDLKMSELTVKSTKYGMKITDAKALPRVDLAGHYKRSSEVYHKNFAANQEASLDPKRKWYAGLEVSVPFYGSTGTYSLYKREDPQTLSTYYGASESKGTTFQLGLLDNVKQFSEDKESEIAYQRAQEELVDMRKKVVMEVKEAYHGYEKAKVQMEATMLQKEFREKEVKILEAKHSLGDVELSDVFEGLVGLLEAYEAYFDAEKSLLTAIAALNNAVGIGDYF